MGKMKRLAVFMLAAIAWGAQKFYPDDPLWREPPPRAVAKAHARQVNDYFDFFLNAFFPPDKEEILHYRPGPSQAVNTLGEVADSTWFTNRIGSRPMETEELVRGPGVSHAPDISRPWVVLSGNNEGITPGLVIRDSAGRKYFLKFDPLENPEMAGAADVIGSKFLYALGYNTPENYIVHFARRHLVVNEKSVFRDPQGHKRPMTDQDVDDVLLKVPREREGGYRGMASLTIAGDLLGPFRYYGTRTDDPNDIVDHENRRDLRGLYVFFAWLNHTDAKAINTMDSLVEEDGLRYVKHYLLDFGDLMGSDSDEAKDPRRGNAYVFQWGPAAAQFLSLGLYVPEWMTASYPHLPSIGRFEYRTFDPENWHPNYPNPAFELRTPGDTYWAAKKVMAFSDDAIRVLVQTGEYSDSRAAEWAARCLIERRNKIGRAFFQDVLPLDGFAVRDGKLIFEDLAVKYGFEAPRSYSVQWSVFDNQSSVKSSLPAPGFEVPSADAPYLAAEIRAQGTAKTLTVYLHDGSVVGIDRTW
jgi:hypothetical protein